MEQFISAAMQHPASFIIYTVIIMALAITIHDFIKETFINK